MMKKITLLLFLFNLGIFAQSEFNA